MPGHARGGVVADAVVVSKPLSRSCPCYRPCKNAQKWPSAATSASGEAIDRSGAGRFVEAYPAAALSIWGFPAKGYKGPKKKDVLAKLVSEFADKTRAWLPLTDEVQSRCRESDDCFDTLVAALVARAAAIG